MGPRIDAADRVAGSGLDFFFAPAAAQVSALYHAALLVHVPAGDISRQAVERFIATLDDEMVAIIPESGAARLAFCDRIVNGPKPLCAENVMTALQHCPTLLAAITADAPGGEALRLVGLLIQMELGNATHTLGNMALVESRVAYMRPRMARGDVPAMPSARVALLEREHRAATAAGSGDQGSGATSGTGGPGLTPSTGDSGYPKVHAEALRTKLNSAQFGTDVARVEGLVAAGSMYDAITAIWQSCEVVLWHALTLRKKAVQGLPVVANIANVLHPLGPAWLGDLAMQAILPPLPPGAPRRRPLLLTAEWEDICKGDVVIDLETLIARAQAHAAGESATFRVVPAKERFRSEIRLMEARRVGAYIYERLGYPSPAGRANTFDAVYELGCAYYSEARSLRADVVSDTVQANMVSIHEERSRQSKWELVGANDPTIQVGGQWATANSAGLEALRTARAQLASTTALAEQLHAIRGESGARIRIAPPDLPPSPPPAPGGPRKPGGDVRPGADARRQLDLDRPKPPDGDPDAGKTKEGEPKPGAADVEIGSLCSLVHFFDAEGKELPPDKEEEAATMQLGAKDVVDLIKFREKAPKGACAAVWCSKHKAPHGLCPHKGEEKHTSRKGGAHKVRWKFRDTVLPLLLVAAVKSEGSAFGCSPALPSVEDAVFSLQPAGREPAPGRAHAPAVVGAPSPFWTPLVLAPAPSPTRWLPEHAKFELGCALFGPGRRLDVIDAMKTGEKTIDVRAFGASFACGALVRGLGEQTVVCVSSPRQRALVRLGPAEVLERGYSELYERYLERALPRSLAAHLPPIASPSDLEAVFRAGFGRRGRAAAPASDECKLLALPVEYIAGLPPGARQTRAEGCGPPTIDGSTSEPPPPFPLPPPPAVKPPLARVAFPDLRALCYFSGEYGRPGGQRHYAERVGMAVVERDSASGGWPHDILNRAGFRADLADCRAGVYHLVTAAPPCSTGSVARLLGDGSGPPVVRAFPDDADGLKDLPPDAQRELDVANLVWRRTCTLLTAAALQGGAEVLIENPSPRNDPSLLGGRLWDNQGRTASHASFWDTTWGRALVRELDLQVEDFAYCDLPSLDILEHPAEPLQPQKYTRVAFSRGLAPRLGKLAKHVCRHSPGSHPRFVGAGPDGKWRSADMSPWPRYLAREVILSGAEARGLSFSESSAPRARESLTSGGGRTGSDAASTGSTLTGAAWHPFGVPTLALDTQGGPAHVFLPITFAGGVGRVGMPSGSPRRCLGAERCFLSRDADAVTAQRWSDAFFAPRLDVVPFWQFTDGRGGDLELSVTSAQITSPPPEGWAERVADTPEAWQAAEGAALVWCSLEALGRGRLTLLAGRVLESYLYFRGDMPEPQRVDLVTGAVELAPLAGAAAQVSAHTPRIPWDEVVRRARNTVMALRAELMRVASLASTRYDTAQFLTGLIDVCREPDYASIPHMLRTSCFEAADTRLAALAFPDHVERVPTDHLAPLPRPPKQSDVPRWATEWTHVIRPAFHERLCGFLTQMLARLTYRWKHGSFEGAPSVEFVAFGADGFVAPFDSIIRAGGVLVRERGRIRLLDQSRTPRTHWSREYLARVLDGSPDLALRDAACTHGFMYLTELEPMVVFMDHLLSFGGPGFPSVHAELARLTDLGWYEMHVALEAAFGDSGISLQPDFPCMPLRVIAQGSVARKLEDRWRRIVDNNQPRRERFTFGERRRVQSMAETCGWKESKAIQALPKSGFLRHTPAVRRPAILNARPQLRRELVTASSRTPTQIRNQLAEGAITVEEAVDALRRPRHPPELKWLFTDFLLALALLSHLAWLMKEPVISLEDDEKDCFHQFVTAFCQRWQCGIVALDPYAMLAGLSRPNLMIFLECCVSMGTPPSSGWAQRLNHELGMKFEEERNDEETLGLRLRAREDAALSDYVLARDALAAQTGRKELKLVVCMIYTDDPIILSIGVERSVRVAAKWHEHMGPRGARFIMSGPLKKSMGVNPAWVGGRALLPGLLAYIDEPKQMATTNGIDSVLEGTATVEAATRLIGLMNHLMCLLLLPYYLMYGVYELVGECDKLRLGQEAAIGPALTQRAAEAFREFKRCVSARPGNTALAAAFGVTSPPTGVAIRRLFSDAALKGTTQPGICGNLYRMIWVFELHGAHRELPVVATEFGGGIGNVLAFHGHLKGAPTALIFDALVVTIVLASKAKSKLLQHMHKLFLELPEAQELLERGDVFVGHIYGPRNAITDRGSRGDRAAAEALISHIMGGEAIWVPFPHARFSAILDSAVALWRTLTPEEQRAEHELKAPERRSPTVDKGPYPEGTKAIEFMLHGDATGVTGEACVTEARGRWDAPPPSAPASAHDAPAKRGCWSPGGGMDVHSAPPRPALPASGTSRLGPMPRPHSEGLRGRWSSLPYARPETLAPPPRAEPPLPATTMGGRDPTSPYALKPLNPELLTSLYEKVQEAMSDSFAKDTRRVDASHWNAWTKVCFMLGTRPFRDDQRANSGLDPEGYRQEIALQAVALILMYADMAPRSRADPAPKVESAVAKLRGVRREHEVRGIQMAPMRLATRVARGLARKAIDQHGVRPPNRKKPLTNDMINAMLAAPEGAEHGGLTLTSWNDYFWVATRAWLSTLAEEGSRKGAIARQNVNTPFKKGRFSFASLVLRLDGVEVAAPTPAQLNSMSEAKMDGFYLKYGVAKNDVVGMFYAATPSFLPFSESAPRNAARALRGLELKAGVAPAMRAGTPLFGPAPGVEFTKHQVVTAFELMLIFGARVPRALLGDYSIHSLRIFVACALLAANVPRPLIKRHLRWRGDEALEIYARLNDPVWRDHVVATYTAQIDSTIAGRLASIGRFDFEPAQLQAVADMAD